LRKGISHKEAKEMRILFFSVLVALLVPNLDVMAQSVVAQKGVLRAAYLSSNPSHAVKDPATGTVRGAVIDLVREWGRRLGVEVSLSGLQSPQNVIAAVQSGQADIGFVAYNPERAGPVEFSKPYMLVQLCEIR
jgi:polar amino acid transport system substrate-binding protein